METKPKTDEKLKVKYIPIKQLNPFIKNPRKNDDAVDRIVKSIEKFGYTNPILCRRDNDEIIAGHARIKALKKMGRKEAPVIYLDLNEADAHTYNIFDNKSVEFAEWDMAILAELMEELKQSEVELEMTGFSNEETEDNIKETELEFFKTKPYKKTHILLSFPPEMLSDIQYKLAEIIDLGDIEYEQSSN